MIELLSLSMDVDDIVWGSTDDNDPEESASVVMVEAVTPKAIVTVSRRMTSEPLESWLEGHVETRLLDIIDAFRTGAREAGAYEKAEAVGIDSDDISVLVIEDNECAELPNDTKTPSSLAQSFLTSGAATTDIFSSFSDSVTLQIRITGETGQHLQEVDQSLSSGSDTDIEEQLTQCLSYWLSSSSG